MMTRIVFFIVTTLCTISYGVVNSQSGLGSLLQQMGTSSSTPSTNSVTATTLTTASPGSSGLSALLSTPTASPVPVVVPDDLQAGLLQQFVTEQSNPLYAKAMDILNDTSLQEVYSNALLSIQLFFMQYATDDLNKLSQQSTAVSKPSLSSLLSAAMSTSAAPSTSSGVVGLSSLLSSAQSAGQSSTTTPAQSSVNGLLQQLRAQSSSTSVVQQPNAGLQSLLDVVTAPSVSGSATGLTLQTGAVTAVTSQKPINSLSMLLAAQG